MVYTLETDRVYKSNKRKRLAKVFFILALILAGGWVLIFKLEIGAKEFIIDGVKGLTKRDSKGLPLEIDDPEYEMPDKEKDRVDILILGVRGKDDVINGGLLTDTIMLFSYDKKTHRSSLISIPRDFYVKVYDDKKEKINAVYVTGLEFDQGLDFTKEVFSRITGVYVDNVVVFDFEAFSTIIDALGGIDVTLAHSFTESTQWGYEFHLPAGKNHLNGQDALYYVRSRYSSSDFDRAQRQQQVLLAVKEKVTSQDLASDPVQALKLLNSIRKNLHTDLNLADTPGLISLGQEISKESNTFRYGLTTENFLYETHVNSMYVLLPVGEKLESVKNLFTNSLSEKPSPSSLPTRTPKPTSS